MQQVQGVREFGKRVAVTTTLYVHYTFLHMSSLSLHNYDVNCLIFTIIENVGKRRHISLSLLEPGNFLGIQLRESSPTFENVSELR